MVSQACENLGTGAPDDLESLSQAQACIMHGRLLTSVHRQLDVAKARMLCTSEKLDIGPMSPSVLTISENCSLNFARVEIDMRRYNA